MSAGSEVLPAQGLRLRPVVGRYGKASGFRIQGLGFGSGVYGRSLAACGSALAASDWLRLEAIFGYMEVLEGSWFRFEGAHEPSGWDLSVDLRLGFED